MKPIFIKTILQNTTLCLTWTLQCKSNSEDQSCPHRLCNVRYPTLFRCLNCTSFVRTSRFKLCLIWFGSKFSTWSFGSRELRQNVRPLVIRSHHVYSVSIFLLTTSFLVLVNFWWTEEDKNFLTSLFLPFHCYQLSWYQLSIIMLMCFSIIAECLFYTFAYCIVPFSNLVIFIANAFLICSN